MLLTIFITLIKFSVVDFKSVKKILPFEGHFFKNTVIDATNTLKKSTKLITHQKLALLDLSGQ